MPPSEHRDTRTVGLEEHEAPLPRGRRSGPAVTVRRAVLVDFGFWTLFGALMASSWLVAPFTSHSPYALRLIGKAFFISYLWAVLTPAVFWLAQRFNPMRGARLPRALLFLALAPAVGLLAAGGESFVWITLNSAVLSGPHSPRHPVWASTRADFFSQVVTFLVVLGAGFAWDIFRRYQAGEREAARLQGQASQLRAERAELRAEAARLQAQSAELNAQLAQARLAVLRTQLNPHFLFNTLNAVSALVAEDPRGVRSMIALLSELLRYTLSDSDEQEIPVREEFRLLRLYLEILEIRYQGQLETVVSVVPEAEDALVPTLILQPLVENAVKHGIDPAGGFGTIHVRAERSGGDLVLSVRDSGSGQATTSAPDRREGVGLRLVRERLGELYGSEARLALEAVPGGGMVARIVLPHRADTASANKLVQSSERRHG